MALPVQPKDILRNFYNDSSRAIWARDLVGLVIRNNGILSDNELDGIIDEIYSPPGAPTVSLAGFTDSPFPRIEICKLNHLRGVKALAPNQSITFCDEGHTYLFGQNGSGKSSFFHLLNQLAGGSIDYPIIGNVYGAQQPKNVEIEYKVDGVPNTFSWDCIATPPTELQHIRLFDSKYSEMYLSHRGNNEYIFKSYCLARFECLSKNIERLKDMGATMGVEEVFINQLCQNSYSAMLIPALQNQFAIKLNELGMNYLQVQLEINDLLKPTAEIKITIVNNSDPSSVLSEAEKKCASLALFLAEYELLDVKQPLVFDDPVNSLDNKIVQNFANMISKINGQVILFTHNAQLLALLKEKDKHEFKIYENSSTPRTAAGKIHVLIYDIVANSPHDPGFVINHKDYKSKYYLDEAVNILAANPVMHNTRTLVDTLRIAVEWMVDEVIFYNQQPLAFRGFTNIPWAKIEQMVQFDPVHVSELHTIYNKLSNTGAHVGFGGVFNPLTRGELEGIKNRLVAIRQTVYP